MNPVDPKIERLIVRQLDGEITEAEQLELNRELLRNPGAHRLWEEYRALDATAGEVLQNLLVDRHTSFDPTTLPSPVTVTVTATRPQFVRRHWLLLTGAVAAAILALAIPRPAVTTNDHSASFVEKTGAQPILVDNTRRPRPVNADGLMRNVSMPSVQRETGTDVFGVLDENGNVYWIEVERTRTLRRPARNRAGRSSREIL